MNYEDILNLLAWYRKEKRDLPWRHTSDSYKIWISEVMLQQTRVEAVKEYYKRFLSVLPNIESLAKVEEDTLLKLWEGLGYYSRARNLKKCAIEVMHLGLKELPREEKELKKLPGIGPYTAGAILSIAYKKCIPAIDGNVMRILSRVYEDDRDILKSSVREEYERILKDLMKEEYAREFTEGFIELGALVCLPNGKPKCDSCPFSSICKSYAHNRVLNYPVKKKKNVRKIEKKTVFVLHYNGKYGIRKRESSGLLASLYELFNVDKCFTKDNVKDFLKEQNIPFSSVSYLGEFKHIFSHIEWHMSAFVVELTGEIEGFDFYSKSKIETEYSLPTAFQKIFKKVK